MRRFLYLFFIILIINCNETTNKENNKDLDSTKLSSSIANNEKHYLGFGNFKWGMTLEELKKIEKQISHSMIGNYYYKDVILFGEKATLSFTFREGRLVKGAYTFTCGKSDDYLNEYFENNETKSKRKKCLKDGFIKFNEYLKSKYGSPDSSKKQEVEWSLNGLNILHYKDDYFELHTIAYSDPVWLKILEEEKREKNRSRKEESL